MRRDLTVGRDLKVGAHGTLWGGGMGEGRGDAGRCVSGLPPNTFWRRKPRGPFLRAVQGGRFGVCSICMEAAGSELWRHRASHVHPELLDPGKRHTPAHPLLPALNCCFPCPRAKMTSTTTLSPSGHLGGSNLSKEAHIASCRVEPLRIRRVQGREDRNLVVQRGEVQIESEGEEG